MANQMGEASEGRSSGKGKPLNSIDHKQSKPVKAWVKNELKQQQKRFKKILEHMEEIAPKRDKWFEEFGNIVQANPNARTATIYRYRPDMSSPE